ncbi:MAG: histidine phosphatase family protein [Eubacteriales bacterium]|jgi:alpha-ribazole phosphatase
MAVIRLLMLRHGATRGNTEKRYIGTTDESILPSERMKLSHGIFGKGAENRVPGFEPEPVIFVSPLKRTSETATAIFPGGRQMVIPEFRECDFGAFENRNYMELSGRSDYQAWIDSGGTLPFPGGESMETFRKRTLSGFDRVMAFCRDASLPSAVLVVHGGTIMSILSAYAKPKGDYYDFQVRPGSGYLVEADSGRYRMSGLRVLEAVDAEQPCGSAVSSAAENAEAQRSEEQKSEEKGPETQ